MADDREAAVARWNAEHPEDWPRQHGTCPACGGGGCFGTMPGSNGDRWACFDTDHATVGRQGDGCWWGDALDLAAHRRGLTRSAVLRADGYLTGDAPPMQPRRAPPLPPLNVPPHPFAADKGGNMDGWKLAGTRWLRLTEPHGAPLSETWAELVARFEAPVTLPAGGADHKEMNRRKAALTGWSAARFVGDKRSTDTLQRNSALVLDLDADPTKPVPACGEPAMDPERLRALLTTVLVAGTAWAAHTTAQSAPEAWRWRVVIPLAEPLERGAYVALVDLLRRTLLTETDAPLTLEGDAGANRDAARLWYGPAQLPERPDDYATCHADGMPMDGNAVLDGCAHYAMLTRDALATRLENDCDAKRKELTDAWQAAKEAAEKAAKAKAKAAETVGKLEWFTPPAEWLTTEPPRREYLLHDASGDGFALRGSGMLPRGKVGILAAAGGVGKTFALTGLALALVTRTKWLGHFPTGDNLRRRVALVLGEEDTGEVQRRLHAQAGAMELDPSIHAPYLAGILALAGAGLDTFALTRPADEESGNGSGTDFARGLYAFLEANAGDGWDAVILDPLSRFAGPDVETDNSAATRLVQVLERFTKLPGEPAVIVAHHTRKPSGKEADLSGATNVRGSSALVDGARWVAKLDAVKTPNGARLPGHALFSVAKSNYGKHLEGDLLLTKLDGGGLRAATTAEEAALKVAEEEAAREEGRTEGRETRARAEGRKETNGTPPKRKPDLS